MASCESGFTGRTGETGGHYHNGSWYRDEECLCPLAPYTDFEAGFGGQDITYECEA